MKELKNLRLGKLEIRKATYLCEEPEIPSYCIDLWYDNPNYGKENEYEKDGEWYISRIEGVEFRHHKSCFEGKESCFSIASFEYDENEGIYELHFICDRPMCLNEEQIKQFWELIKYGYEYLNNNQTK